MKSRNYRCAVCDQFGPGDGDEDDCTECLTKCPLCTSVVYTSYVTTGPTTTTDTKDPNDCSECQKECPLSKTTSTNEVSQQAGTETITNTGQESALEKQAIRAGCTIGGALVGSLVTVLVFMLRRQIHKKQIRNLISKALQNPAYQAETVCIKGRSREEANTKDMYSEIKDQKSMKASQAESNDSMYNHLNETETVHRGEYYDHARPGHSVSTPSDGCGTVTVDYDQARPGHSVSTPPDGCGTVTVDYDHARPSHSVSTPADGYGTVTVEYDGNEKSPEDDKSMIYNDKLVEKAKADEYFVLEKIQ